MSFPELPAFPDDDPIGALKLFKIYIVSISDYLSAMKLFGGVSVLMLVIFVGLWMSIGFDLTLSWASDFVPLAFAVISIAVTLKKLERQHHQNAVIGLIILFGIVGTVVLHLSRSRQEDRITAGLRQNSDALVQIHNMSRTMTPQEAAVDRLQTIEKALRGEYIFTHKNISPGLLAGTEPPPTEWMNQRLQDMGEKWRFSEPTSESKKASSQAGLKVQKPEVALEFVDPTYPSLVIKNVSSVVAESGSYAVELWNMERLDDPDPLKIPSAGFGFIRANKDAGPQNIFWPVASSLKQGDRLFGSAIVDCPLCKSGKTYIVYIQWGVGGWYSEIKGKEAGQLIIPIKLTADQLPSYFASLEELVPIEERIPIKQRVNLSP